MKDKGKDRKRRIYISGPITGVPDYMGRFEAAETVLKSVGWDVVNPARLLEPVANMLEYDETLMVCLTLLDACDAVQMLSGWKNSRGARIEFKYALGKSMDIYAEED